MKQGWEIKKLGEVCNKLTDGSHNPPKGVTFSNYEMLSSQNIFNDKINYQDVRYISYDDFLKEDKRTSVRDGDILLTIVGTIGRCAVFTGGKNVTLQRSVAVIRTKDGNSRFLMYCFIGKNLLLNECAHGIAQKGLYLKQLYQIEVPVPPREEQERIVEELDCLSGIIEKKREQLKELDALAQSIFYTMFGDPITNEKGWEVKKLGEVGKVITGNTPSTKDEENYSSNDYCFVKPSDIGKDYVSNIEKTEFYISEKAFSQSRKLCKGSVLTTCIGIIGKVGILKVDATCNQQINAIQPNDNYISEYVAWAIYLTRSVIEEIANAPVVPIINKGEFSNIVIPLPPKDLQQKFADKIVAIERQKELIKQSIAETEELFNSRMAFYFN